jgi:2,3-bisphosphoglycerate-independent phosphoglycerate mutase
LFCIIRDGWGVNPGGRSEARANGDATLLARTPFHDHLYANYPQARLSASGMDVGLPPGQMGNSEVGHLNLGQVRIVYQDLTRINKAILDGELATNQPLQEAFTQARTTRLHLVGLVSDGGVHSHIEHLVALADAAAAAGVGRFSCTRLPMGATLADGRAGYLGALQAGLKQSNAYIATVIGRYFLRWIADMRWERTKLAWMRSCSGAGQPCEVSPADAVAAAYSSDPRG